MVLVLEIWGKGRNLFLFCRFRETGDMFFQPCRRVRKEEKTSHHIGNPMKMFWVPEDYSLYGEKRS